LSCSIALERHRLDYAWNGTVQHDRYSADLTHLELASYKRKRTIVLRIGYRVNELLVSWVPDLDTRSFFLLLTPAEEVAERFRQTIRLVLEHLAVHRFEPLILTLQIDD
jgi:hypothetical protein